MTPNQLANVRRIMKDQRAKRREAANRAADRRDYEAINMRETSKAAAVRMSLAGVTVARELIECGA